MSNNIEIKPFLIALSVASNIPASVTCITPPAKIEYKTKNFPKNIWYVL